MKIVDAKVMRRLDRAAIKEYGVSGLQLMENAGSGLAGVVLRVLSEKPEKPKKPKGTAATVSIIAGKGNNGGDGFVCARHLKEDGVKVTVFSTAPVSSLTGDAGANARAWERMEGETKVIASRAALKKHASALRHSAVIVDALFGTGLTRDVGGVAALLIELINDTRAFVVSVDVPSGLDATTGRVLGSAVMADITVTMALGKLGLYLYPGRELAGSVESVDIGMPAKLMERTELRWELLCEETIRSILRARAETSHKGNHGHLLVTGGSSGKSGAVYMAAIAAMRSGAGLVTLAVPDQLAPLMEIKTTEVMTASLPESTDDQFGDATLCADSIDALAVLLDGKDAMIVGPGLGRGADVRKFMEGLLSMELLPPTVIDADGLNALALTKKRALIKKAGLQGGGPPFVLTPHSAEMARLLGTDAGSVEADRIGSAEKLSKATGAVVVLKGASTIIASPDGLLAINPTGNPALATAGTGDILSGLIGALLAQHYSAWDAARAAVYLHGLAADDFAEIAGGPKGMIATDLLSILPELLNRYTG